MALIIKHCLEFLKNAYVIPIGWRFVIVVGDSLEPVIINDMILWRDVSSSEIPNKPDCVCVDWREPEVLATARARAPLGYLSSC